MNETNINGFTKICSLDDLKERAGKRFIVNEVEVAIFKLEGKIYALSNICPHQHTSMIYDGFIEHGCVICPAHGWIFDLQTGKTPMGRKGLDTYETKVVDNYVFAKVSPKDLNW